MGAENGTFSEQLELFADEAVLQHELEVAIRTGDFEKAVYVGRIIVEVFGPSPARRCKDSGPQVISLPGGSHGS